MMMGGLVEELALVALGADGVRFIDDETVGIMAIAAEDAGRIHPTLDEGAPDVDLVKNLTVGVIETLVEQCRAENIEKISTAFGNSRPT
jgi:hypothetical protein